MPDRHPSDPESALVNHNLSDADKIMGVPKVDHSAGKLVPGAPEHAEATIFGVISGPVVVSVAMLAFLLILLIKKVPSLIGGALDRQIADIRRQLDEAKALRAEAEALRDDYARKMADAEGSARDMIAHAEAESEQIVAKAKVDAADLVTRRSRMAEDKIAAAERQAIADVRARAADAATKAATAVIAARLDAGADKALVDRTIGGLGRPN